MTDVTDVAGNVTHFGYDTAHHLVSILDPRQAGSPTPAPVTLHYDTNSRVDRLADQLRRTTTYDYTSVPQATLVTDPAGHVTEDTYVYGELISETRGYGTSTAATWLYVYDASYLTVLSVNDPNGHLSLMSYDSHGNLATKTDPLSRTTSWTYDSLHDATSVTDPNGVTATFAYDANGNLLSKTTPWLQGPAGQQQTVTYGYGDAIHPGDLTSTTDPNSNVTSLSYDSNGDLTKTVDPLGNTTTLSYDSVGRRTQAVSPRGNTTGANPATYTTSWAYNPRGQVLSITDPLGNKSTYHYDADGNVDSARDADLNTTTYTYDLANERTNVGRADGTSLQTIYNADGTVAGQTDGAGNTTSYGYDNLGRIAQVTDPLGRTTAYAYDLAGNLTQLTRPSASPGSFEQRTYDAANELTSVSSASGSSGVSASTAPIISSITYDADGERTAMTDTTGTSSYTWDSLHRLTSSTDPNGQTVTYTYDLASQLTTIGYPGAGTVSRQYDKAGRPSSVQDWLGNQTAFAYDADSNLISETLPAATRLQDVSTYDAADRHQSTTFNAAGLSYATVGYSRDPAGLVGSSTPTGLPDGAQNYTYTPLQQISTVNAAAYGYDAADNPTKLPATPTVATGPSTAQAFDAANELCATSAVASASPSCTATSANTSIPAGTTAYAYDQDGNRTAQAGAAGNATYGWDSQDRLVAVSTTGSPCSVTTGPSVGCTIYAYNGDGLRVSKTSSNGTASATEPYVWNTAQGLPTILQDGTTRYVYGPGGLPLEQINGTNVAWYHHDALGSTRALTNNAGTVLATFAYTPYGTTSATTGTTRTPFGFAGQYQDAETGLYYLRARYYDPTTGQFLSRDPLFAATGSAYGYAGDDPINGGDPSGLGPLGLCFHNPFGNDHCDSLWKQHPGLHGPLVGTAVVAGAVACAGLCLPALSAVAPGAATAIVTTAAGLGTAGTIASLVGLAPGETAAESDSEFVNLASEERTSHILDGEFRENGTFGGGHRAGTGLPGKSEFPASWSDEQIMHNISDVATDPNSVFTPGRGGDLFATGARDGIDIAVLLRGGGIWTGYPTNVPRNPW